MINYPYKEEGYEYEYVSANNPFMQAAKEAAAGHGCRKHATSAVLVKDEEIILSASNAGIHVKVCPRVYKGYRTGEGYRYCKEYCSQEGHSEVMLHKKSEELGIDTEGSDLYLYGHWWICQNCWQSVKAMKVNRIFLAKGSEIDFNVEVQHPGVIDPEPELEIYVAGPMTHVKNKEIVYQLYLDIGELGDNLGFKTCVPFRDIEAVVENPTPEYVYDTCSEAVRRADLVIAYVGDTSLGVGMELECANRYKSLVILLSEEGTNVSTMVTGSPAVIDHIQFSSKEDAMQKLEVAVKKFKETARQQNISVKS